MKSKTFPWAMSIVVGGSFNSRAFAQAADTARTVNEFDQPILEIQTNLAIWPLDAGHQTNKLELSA